MIIGILSDSHGQAVITARAIAMLRDAGAEFFFHCGDVGDRVLELLPARQSAFVFGNNDWDHQGLEREAMDREIRCLAGGGVVEIDGKRIAMTHGDDTRTLNAMLSGDNDYVLSGHTHVPHDVRVGTTRRINPGALFRARRKTVATLNLSTDELLMLEVRQ